jgi:hypothetical protein
MMMMIPSDNKEKEDANSKRDRVAPSSLSCPYTRTISVFYAFYAFYAWRLGFHFPQSVCSGFLRQESDNQPKFQCKEHPVATVTAGPLPRSVFFLSASRPQTGVVFT